MHIEMYIILYTLKKLRQLKYICFKVKIQISFESIEQKVDLYNTTIYIFFLSKYNTI